MRELSAPNSVNTTTDTAPPTATINGATSSNVTTLPATTREEPLPLQQETTPNLLNGVASSTALSSMEALSQQQSCWIGNPISADSMNVHHPFAATVGHFNAQTPTSAASAASALAAAAATVSPFSPYGTNTFHPHQQHPHQYHHHHSAASTSPSQMFMGAGNGDKSSAAAVMQAHMMDPMQLHQQMQMQMDPRLYYQQMSDMSSAAAVCQQYNPYLAPSHGTSNIHSPYYTTN